MKRVHIFYSETTYCTGAEDIMLTVITLERLVTLISVEQLTRQPLISKQALRCWSPPRNKA